MRLFRVVTERDGSISKDGSRAVTDIERTSTLYASPSITVVWKEAKRCLINNDSILSIEEVAPAVFILEDEPE